jgi:hypothetical protein
LGLSFSALAALVACSSSKSAGVDAAGGGAGAGGASGAAGGGGGGTTGGAGGTGGATGGTGGGVMCDPQYANGYEADFDITVASTVTAGSYCFVPCTGVAATFKSPGGATLELYAAGGSCPDATRCDTCTLSRCPGHSCPQPTFPQTFRWNGDYAIAGSCGGCKTPGCGPAIACQSLGCAAPGHYSATFCATRVAADAGATCVPGAPTCTTVEFDLPSTAHIAVQLQP